MAIPQAALVICKPEENKFEVISDEASKVPRVVDDAQYHYLHSTAQPKLTLDCNLNNGVSFFVDADLQRKIISHRMKLREYNDAMAVISAKINIHVFDKDKKIFQYVGMSDPQPATLNIDNEKVIHTTLRDIKFDFSIDQLLAKPEFFYTMTGSVY